MALLRLIKILMIIACSTGVAFAELNCREVSMMSKNIKASEKVKVCFLKDDSYFISQNCKDLSCDFMLRLKKQTPDTSSDVRPGTSMCEALKGIVEVVTVGEQKNHIQRCIFAKDQTSISLNLLESWNGKKFTGPSQDMAL